MKALIIGAGITGATIARKLAETNHYTIDIIDKEQFVGGACFDSNNEAYIQAYGAHIFNTTNKQVWDFVSKHTKWTPFMHKVLALVDGSYVPLPFNLNTLDKLMSKEFSLVLERKFTDLCTNHSNEFTLKELRDNEDNAIRQLGEYIYEKVFKYYSLKQWECEPAEDVINRVKAFRYGRDDRYFTTDMQGIPKDGYTSLIQSILSHPAIAVHLNTVVTKDSLVNVHKDYDRIFYTGPVDELMNYEYGELPYRTCTFDLTLYKAEHFLQAPVVNYPNSYEYTRAHDYSYFMPSRTGVNCLSVEYPAKYDRTNPAHKPFYPINTKENQDLYDKYVSAIQELCPNVVFAGRLGTYKYFSMDKAIEQAFELAEPLVERIRSMYY